MKTLGFKQKNGVFLYLHFGIFSAIIAHQLRGNIMIGEVLRGVRIANDAIIKEVSKNSNVPVSYLTNLEKNKKNNSSINTLEKICLAHNLNVSDLFELDEYHKSIIGLKEQLKIYQLLLIKVLKLYDKKENIVLKK